MGASPQRGYNHNIAHRGRVYHVQSEDSGLAKSHIYTHVFVNGTIIATNKVDYDPASKTEDLAGHVVTLMQASHKKMIKQLRGGDLDQKIEVLLGGHPDSANGEAIEAKSAPSAPAQSPGPVLAQQKISRTPPARRNTGPAPAPASKQDTARHPALRSPLSASEHAQDWLANRHPDSPPPAQPEPKSDAKSRLAQLRQLLTRQVVEPNKVPVEEELSQLFADHQQ